MVLRDSFLLILWFYAIHFHLFHDFLLIFYGLTRFRFPYSNVKRDSFSYIYGPTRFRFPYSMDLRDLFSPIQWSFAIHLYLFSGSMRFILTFSMILRDSSFPILWLCAIISFFSMVLSESHYTFLLFRTIHFFFVRFTVINTPFL